jgi:hypothetical protein
MTSVFSPSAEKLCGGFVFADKIIKVVKGD